MGDITLSRMRFVVVAVLISTVTSLGIANAATPTNSSTSIRPYSAQGCSGNTCIYLSTPSSGTVFVQGWAYGTSFVGYFKLTTPTITVTSPTQTWLGSKGNYFQVSGISAVVGPYCVAGYSSGGMFEGKACESVL